MQFCSICDEARPLRLPYASPKAIGVCEECFTDHIASDTGPGWDDCPPDAESYLTASVQFERFDICEAWWLAANTRDSGLRNAERESIQRRLARIEFRPARGLRVTRNPAYLTENGLAIYARLVSAPSGESAGASAESSDA